MIGCAKGGSDRTLRRGRQTIGSTLHSWRSLDGPCQGRPAAESTCGSLQEGANQLIHGIAQVRRTSVDPPHATFRLDEDVSTVAEEHHTDVVDREAGLTADGF